MPKVLKDRQLSIFETAELDDQFLPEQTDRCLLCSIMLSDDPKLEYRHRVMRTPRLALCEWCDMRLDVAEQDERNGLTAEFWPTWSWIVCDMPYSVAMVVESEIANGIVVRGRVVDFVEGERIEGWIGRDVRRIGGVKSKLDILDIDRYNAKALRMGIVDAHCAPTQGSLAAKLRREILINVERGVFYESSQF